MSIMVDMIMIIVIVIVVVIDIIQDGRTALFVACYKGQMEIIKILLQYGATVDDKTEVNIIYYIVYYGYYYYGYCVVLAWIDSFVYCF